MTESYAIAEQLGERAPQAVALIGRIVRQLGSERARALVEQVQQVERDGGMLTEEGDRRRTPGGVFFFLVKEQLRSAGQEELIAVLFPRRQARRKAEPQQAAPAAAGPPILQGRLRPRMRGRSEQPPAATLAPAAREQPVAPRPPTQDVVLRAIERHLGPAPDIYRRSYNPATGAMTLLSHFPPIARARYADAIAAAAQEAGVPIALSPQPHQGMLAEAARAALPEGFPVLRVAVHVGRETVVVSAPEPLDPAELAAAQERFQAQTGYQLAVVSAEG